MGLAIVAGVYAQEIPDKTDEIVEAGRERLEEGRTAQARIDAINEETEKLVSKFQERLKIVEGLDVYNQLVQQQIDNQDREIVSLKQSIIDVAVIERQIMPLLTRMLDKLEQFIQMDMPFLLDERMTRVDHLRDLLIRADLTLAEKSRRVFEAYQIENEYSRTIESYKGQLTRSGENLDVEFLRVGRIALIYQDLSGKHVGIWNPRTLEWESMDESFYRRHLQKGLKITRQEMAPELFTIPLALDKEVR